MGVGFGHELVGFEGGCSEFGGGGNDEPPGWLDPFAAIVDACAGMDSAEDDIGIGSGLVGVLDEEFGGETQVLAATLVKTLGARVTIDGVVIRELVILLNQLGVAPTDEGLFDVGAVGVTADGAFARVALEIGESGRFLAVRTGGFVGVTVEGIGDVLCGAFAGNDFGEMYRWGLELGLGAGLVFALGSVLGNYFGEGACGRGGKGLGRRVRVRRRFRLQF